MKNIDRKRQRFNRALVMLICVFMTVFAWYLAPFSKLIAGVAMIAIPASLLAHGLWLAFTYVVRLPGKLRINAHANARNRHYLIARLTQLAYEPDHEYGHGNDGYVAYDPADEHTVLTIHPFDTEVLGVRYVVSFHSREFIGAASIGNRYRHVTDTYTFVEYACGVKRVLTTYESAYDDAAEETPEDVKITFEKRMSDVLIARIELALNNWARAPVGT